MSHKTAQQLLHELSWGLLGGISKRPYRCLGGVTEATLASASAYFTHYHGPPMRSPATKTAPPQTMWTNNWRYYVEHRRHINKSLPHRQWLIVSRGAIMLHHSDQNLVFEALRRHYWPGAIMVCTERTDERLVVVAPDRPDEQPRLVERASLFDSHSDLLDIMAQITHQHVIAIEPLVYCEVPTDEGSLIGVRWEQMAAVFRRDGHYVTLMTDQLDYLYMGDDDHDERDMYGLCVLARQIDNAMKEEIQYECARLSKEEKHPTNE